jgi:hypothetical protein
MPTYTNNVPPGMAFTDIYPFSDEEMLDFRLIWLRDFVAINCVRDVAVSVPGTGYVVGDALVFTPDMADTTGGGAAGYVSDVDPITGAINNVKLTSLGSLYTVDPTITVTSVAGVNATLTPTRATVKLSAQNQATGREYFSNADINGLLKTLLIDRRDDFMAAYYDKLNEGIYSNYPQDKINADVYARYVQVQICYRFLRAECRETMLNDPGFQGTVPDHARDKFFQQWNAGIAADRNWARQRTGGFGSLQRRFK